MVSVWKRHRSLKKMIKCSWNQVWLPWVSQLGHSVYMCVLVGVSVTGVGGVGGSADWEGQIEDGDCRWEHNLTVAGGAALTNQNCLLAGKMSSRCSSGQSGPDSHLLFALFFFFLCYPLSLSWRQNSPESLPAVLRKGRGFEGDAVRPCPAAACWIKAWPTSSLTLPKISASFFSRAADGGRLRKTSLCPFCVWVLVDVNPHLHHLDNIKLKIADCTTSQYWSIPTLLCVQAFCQTSEYMQEKNKNIMRGIWPQWCIFWCYWHISKFKRAFLFQLYEYCKH